MVSGKEPEVLPPSDPPSTRAESEPDTEEAETLEGLDGEDVEALEAAADALLLEDSESDEEEEDDDEPTPARRSDPRPMALADGSPILSRRPVVDVLPGKSSAPLPVPVVDDSARLPTTSGGTALSQYMAQLGRHAPISREEEHGLAVRWREDGDVDAARQLVLSNLRLVVKIAMEYRRAWTNTLDLIQEGNIGLMEAVQRFDPYQGVKLSSYAVYWIRAYILKYILDNMRSVRLGTTRASRKLFFRLSKEKAALERQGFEAEPRLIAERLDVSEQDVLEMENRLSRPDTYLDAPVRRDESGSMTVGDTFATPGTSAEAAVADEELRTLFMEVVEEFCRDLGDRDLQIMRERVLADEPRTLADMGEEFGVSRERVRQLEARLIVGLRKLMSERMVDFEYYLPENAED